MDEIAVKEGKIKCSRCGDFRKFVNTVQAEELTRRRRRTIHYWMAEGKVFVVVTPSGRKLLCSGCLIKSAPED